MKQQIEKAVRDLIESNHKTGTHAGGSGHLGHVDIDIGHIDHSVQNDGTIRVHVKYTLTTTTEFTYYPDNPPREDHYEQELLLDKDFRLIRES
jgi:hypothetical protein